MKLSKEFIKELIKEQLDEMDAVNEAQDAMYFIDQAIRLLSAMKVPGGAAPSRENIETVMGQLQQALQASSAGGPVRDPGSDFSASKEAHMAPE